MYSTAEEDAENTVPANVAEMTTSASTITEQTPQQQSESEAVANLAINEKQEKQDELSTAVIDGTNNQEDSDTEKEADYTCIDPADI